MGCYFPRRSFLRSQLGQPLLTAPSPPSVCKACYLARDDLQRPPETYIAPRLSSDPCIIFPSQYRTVVTHKMTIWTQEYIHIQNIPSQDRTCIT